MTSIRGALTWRLLGGLALLLAACGGALYVWVRAELTEQFDESLRGRGAGLVSVTRWDEGKVEVDFAAEAMPWYEPGEHAEYFEVRRPEGAGGLGEGVVARSPSLGDAAMPGGAQDRKGEGASDARLADGRRGRMLALEFRPAPDDAARDGGVNEAEGRPPELRLVVAKGREELDGALGVLGVSLTGAGLAIALGAVLVVRGALARGLRPLERLSDEMRAINAETLAARFEPGAAPGELRPVYERLNDLLGRVGAAFERERRFTGAAAHELRTPIAELRAAVEVSLSRERGAEESRATLVEALAVTVQMDRLVESLFALARHDGGRCAAELERVEIGRVVRRVCAKHENEAALRGGAIGVTEDGLPFHVMADESLLEAILENMVGNAVSHSTGAPMVQVRAWADRGGQSGVEVVNPAAGVRAVEVERFFEPFWRRSESRSEREHLGLGLALARRFAEMMGGTLAADLLPEQRVRLALTLNNARNGANQPEEGQLPPHHSKAPT